MSDNHMATNLFIEIKQKVAKLEETNMQLVEALTAAIFYLDASGTPPKALERCRAALDKAKG